VTTAYPGPGGSASADQGPGGSRPDVSGASIGELFGEVSRDLSTLMRQEMELAKAEIKQEITKTGKGAGMLGGAGFAGYMVLLFLSIALWWALANVMNEAWAALIVALLWVVIGAVLYVRGRAQLRAVNPKPEQTVDTLKQVPDALKGR
jgi:Putative Actinobacterial Holin-X, holin superfamily III